MTTLAYAVKNDNFYEYYQLIYLKTFRVPNILVEISSILYIFGIIYQIRKSNSTFSSKSDFRKNVTEGKNEK